MHDLLMHEYECWSFGHPHVAGVDEAGRGHLAGPVVVAGAIFEKDVIIDGVTDSKQLTESEREEFFEIINEPHFKKHYTLYDEDKLKKLPSAYVGKSYPEPELLKLKHYIASRQLSDDFFSNPDWKKIIIEDFEKNKRLNQFLNSVFEK